MNIERVYRPKTVEYNELDYGQVFSDCEGEGLYLLIGRYGDTLKVFDLEVNCLDELNFSSGSTYLIRKVKLVVED